MVEWFKKKAEESPGLAPDGARPPTGVGQAVKGVMYGMASHGHVMAALRARMYLEHLFMFITLGDMLGIPVLPPYYSLRILPYVVPNIASWKRRVFRERDFTDAIY